MRKTSVTEHTSANREKAELGEKTGKESENVKGLCKEEKKEVSEEISTCKETGG